jgi:hypothetical protein
MQLAPTHQAQHLEGPLPLPELTERVRAVADPCRDHTGVILRHTRIGEDGLWAINGITAQLTAHALGQLCARLVLPEGGTVPAGYLARCPPVLAALNLNHWLTDPGPPARHVLVRIREGAGEQPCTVRAVLSDRYVALDHLPLLKELRELAPRYDLVVRHWSLDDHLLTLRLHVNADHPASSRDPLQVGVHLANSEVGRGAVAFTALVTRRVCSNGLVVKVADLGGFRRRHVGRVGEELPQIIREALLRTIAEADRAAYRFARLREQAAPQPVVAFIERTAQRLGLAPEWASWVELRLEGETLYDVVNAFTLAAQQFPVAERIRIETAMSQFLQDGGAET